MSRKPYLFFLLLHIYYKDFAFGKLRVIQTPEDLNLFKGDTAKITCNWTTGDATRIRVEWRKYNRSLTEAEYGVVLSFLASISKNNTTLQQRPNNNTSYSISNTTTMMTIDSVTEKDVGLYICQIIIETPLHITGQGNGTLLNVRESDHSGGADIVSGHLTYPAILMGILLVVVLAGYFLCKRRTRTGKNILQKREQEAVELNQVNQENIDAEEDSSSSTRSVQWALSTLYESLDYFAMKNPEDKSAACSSINLVGSKALEES